MTAKILVGLAGLALVVLIKIWFFPRRRRGRSN